MAYLFTEATGDVVSCGSPANWANELAFLVLFKHSGQSAARPVVLRDWDGSHENSLTIRADGSYSVFISMAGGSRSLQVGTAPTGAWRWVGVTCAVPDGSAPTRLEVWEAALGSDLSQIAGTPTGTGVGPIATSTNPLEIGNRIGHTAAFDGTIAVVLVFAESLTGAQMDAITKDLSLALNYNLLDARILGMGTVAASEYDYAGSTRVATVSGVALVDAPPFNPLFGLSEGSFETPAPPAPAMSVELSGVDGGDGTISLVAEIANYVAANVTGNAVFERSLDGGATWEQMGTTLITDNGDGTGTASFPEPVSQTIPDYSVIVTPNAISAGAQTTMKTSNVGLDSLNQHYEVVFYDKDSYVAQVAAGATEAEALDVARYNTDQSSITFAGGVYSMTGLDAQFPSPGTFKIACWIRRSDGSGSKHSTNFATLTVT